MVRCNNPKCKNTAQGDNYTICRKCGFVMYPIKKIQKKSKEFINGD